MMLYLSLSGLIRTPFLVFQHHMVHIFSIIGHCTSCLLVSIIIVVVSFMRVEEIFTIHSFIGTILLSKGCNLAQSNKNKAVISNKLCI